MTRAAACAAAALLLAAHLPQAARGDFIRGVTVSTQTWGQEWASPEMRASLDELQSMGVTSVAIHPYARIHADGRLAFPEEPAREAMFTRPLDWARERGIGVMLAPHIAYWETSPFLWRGEIDFATDAEWERFFTDYERWIVGLARIAEAGGAGIFCIGLEYSHAVRHESRWREIIAAVRSVYHGRITYGANWDTYRDVPFWDALDYIGVLAYFPLTRNPRPTVTDLVAAWERWMPDLEAISREHGKQILFAEIGYNFSAKAAEQPWAYAMGGPDAALVQERCIEAALVLQRRHEFLAGMYWWKWFPRVPQVREENFDLRRPAIRSIIARRWGRAAKPPSIDRSRATD